MTVIIFGIQSTTLTSAEKQYLKQDNSAGVILFSRNYESPAQLRDLCHSIRETAPEALICVDHEGGRVQRFKDYFSALPPAAAFGKVFNDRPVLASQLAHAAGCIAAYELREYDIDFTFAPVLDLQDARSSVIGTRAFHHNPAVVSELSQAFRDGLRAMGMAAVGKHFPGHGRVIGDSHHTLPYDQRDSVEREQDLYPFLRNIASDIEAIMPAHILYPALDKQYPASFSPVVIQSLRNYAFDGAIITDDLDMHGAEQFNDPIEKVQTALSAGADCALICNNFADIEQVLSASFTHVDKTQSQVRLSRLRARDLPSSTCKDDYERAVNLIHTHSVLLRA